MVVAMKSKREVDLLLPQEVWDWAVRNGGDHKIGPRAFMELFLELSAQVANGNIPTTVKLANIEAAEELVEEHGNDE